MRLRDWMTRLEVGYCFTGHTRKAKPVGFGPSDGEDMTQRIFRLWRPSLPTYDSRDQSSRRDRKLSDMGNQYLSIDREPLTIYDKVGQH